MWYDWLGAGSALLAVFLIYSIVQRRRNGRFENRYATPRDKQDADIKNWRSNGY